MAGRVGPRLGVGARGTDAQQFLDGAQEHGRRVAEVLRQALLDGRGNAASLLEPVENRTFPVWM